MNGIFTNYLWTMFCGSVFWIFESCDFPAKIQIDVSVFMLDLRMMNMSSECEYDWCWKISACSTEYEVCDSFASLTHHQASNSGSVGWYFQDQSIHIHITYTYYFQQVNTIQLLTFNAVYSWQYVPGQWLIDGQRLRLINNWPCPYNHE